MINSIMKIYTIYKATNTVNNKSYIGFDSTWPKRIAAHKSEAKLSTAASKPFYRAIKKYGWESFTWEPIYQSPDRDHCLTEMERYFINEYRTFVGHDDCNGYNLTLGGEGTFGHIKSHETIETHRRKLTGRKQTADHIAARVAVMILHPNFGKPTGPRAPEVGEAIRKRLKGVPKSESHKKAMRLRPQDTVLLTCPHCGKIGDYKNMKRWHMDNCQHNLSRVIKEENTVVCEVCGHSAKQTPNFYKNHNAHCKVGRD